MKYRKELNNFLVISFLAVTFAFLLSVSLWLFNKAFVEMDRKYIDNFVGAFAGAFFAFIFIRLGHALSRIYDRRVQNHNALVQIEHHLNDCLNIIGDNYFTCEEYIKAVEAMNSSTEINLLMSRLESIPIKKELLISLINIDLINDLFSFHQHIRKLNDDMTSSNEGYELIKKAFIERRVSPERYIAYAKIGIPTRNNLKTFLLSAKEEIIHLTAAIRILLKNKPLLLSFVRLFAASHYDDNFKQQQAEEVKKINKEIAENTKSSLARINATLQK